MDVKVLRIITWSSILLGCVLFAGCSKKITPAELMAQLQGEHPPLVIDVRSQAEYKDGHIINAVHIPFWAVIAQRKQIVSTKKNPAVLYCASGARAVLAHAMLLLVGKGPFVMLDGQMYGWHKQGYPVQRGLTSGIDR